MKFHEVWMIVLPKKKAEAAARNELARTKAKLAELMTRIQALQEQLDILKAKFEKAVADKLECEQEEEKMMQAIDLANRLTNGLSTENARWKDTVVTLNAQLVTFPGDMLVVASFVSYLGGFSRKYRTDLLNKSWIPKIESYQNPRIPLTDHFDPMKMLADDSQIAVWQNEGLPSDRMSAENAAILTGCARWPLMIDPQLQGIKWVKQKYGTSLIVLRLGAKNYLDKIEQAVTNGSVVLIENIGESVDPVLDNVLGRNLIKKQKFVKIGDREIEWNKKFKLILHTKLGNPHYQPEIQAQATLINFMVTRDGLEEQLLAEVVKAERPDLETAKANLTKAMNTYKITLKLLEDELLVRLTNAGPDILSDRVLVEKLESTKRTAEVIETKMNEAKNTTSKINATRDLYRAVAVRASLLYFIMNDLQKINPIYQFSLKAFSIVFQSAMIHAEHVEHLSLRVENLIETITFDVFMYTSRALFESDKMIFLSILAIQIQLRQGDISARELDFLLRYPYMPNLTPPIDFLSPIQWGGIRALTDMDEFKGLDKDIEGSAKRWKKFVEGDSPERDRFPQDWKNKTAFQKCLMMRALRADRMVYAMRHFAEQKLGVKYVQARMLDYEKSHEETSSTIAVFFILSAGVDPTRDVERVGKKMGFSSDKKNFHNVSLGQGQEVVAERALETGCKLGHWVILQNIHLVTRWLPTLDKKMEAAQLKPHPDFRLFISAEPAPDPTYHVIPQGVLESSIKITNEPPTGMQANIHKALDNFNQDTLEMCSKESEFKAILFSLCYFHAVVAERRKFGPQGWNRRYPFNVGDLAISCNVLYNYLENNNSVPWEDLRYLFGEIMYGGHITDNMDRRLCRTYLQEYMCPELLEGDLYYCPGFQAPPNTDYLGYHKYTDAMLPQESPILYGLHPNAEYNFLTTQAQILFDTIFALQPRDTGGETEQTISKEDKVKGTLDEILDKLGEAFAVQEMMAKTEDRSPFTIVAFQECDRMNILTNEMKRSLRELSQGLRGELTISRDMEVLQEALYIEKVPDSWTAKAYPSNLGLAAWFVDQQARLKELEVWTGDFILPATIWLGGLFNPQSFLTAIMQTTARKNEWPLDRMCLQFDVTKRIREEFSAAPREGAYLCLLYMEGARWDTAIGSIVESRPKELYPLMPVIHARAILVDKQDLRSVYECPAYKTKMRGPTFVWFFNLKTKAKPAKWILAGVGLLLSV